MTESAGQLAAVEQLLAESDALRGWLARLDQAPPAASDTVRERVRRDYQQRLDQLAAGLAAHMDVVVAKLADHRREHADLTARAAGARDGLAEAELRHAVGEYDDSRFAGERHRFASDLETFDVALAAASEQIARLEAVQSAVQRTPQPNDLELEPATAPAVEVHELSIGALAPEEDAALAVFDEPEGPADSAESPPPASSDSGPLSFRPSGVGGEWPRPVTAPPPRPRPFETAPPLGIPAADVPPRFIRPGERLAGPPAPPANAPSAADIAPFAPRAAPPDEPASPAVAAESGGAPAGRTLRCGECGAMNRPLEWYCEKCGAELTAV